MNVLVALILIFVLIVTIGVITSSGKGYTELFGTALVTVQSGSMEGEADDNFFKGDLLLIKVLKDEQKSELAVGDVITFYDNSIRQDQLELNSHRIVDIFTADGELYFQTKGDNNDRQDDFVLPASAVVGKFNGKIENIGGAIDWMRSSTGFFVCIVLPSLLIVAYFAFNLIWTIAKSKKEVSEQERERIRREVMMEMQAQEEEKKKDSSAGANGEDHSRE